MLTCLGTHQIIKGYASIGISYISGASLHLQKTNLYLQYFIEN